MTNQKTASDPSVRRDASFYLNLEGLYPLFLHLMILFQSGGMLRLCGGISKILSLPRVTLSDVNFLLNPNPVQVGTEPRNIL